MRVVIAVWVGGGGGGRLVVVVVVVVVVVLVVGGVGGGEETVRNLLLATVREFDSCSSCKGEGPPVRSVTWRLSLTHSPTLHAA